MGVEGRWFLILDSEIAVQSLAFSRFSNMLRFTILFHVDLFDSVPHYVVITLFKICPKWASLWLCIHMCLETTKHEIVGIGNLVTWVKILHGPIQTCFSIFNISSYLGPNSEISITGWNLQIYIFDLEHIVLRGSIDPLLEEADIDNNWKISLSKFLTS